MSNVYRFCLQIILLTVARDFCVGYEKSWIPDLEWETAGNWLNDRIPETDSRVIFPLETRHAVGIGRSGNLRLSEIDLPRSGSLVLPKTGKLEVSPTSNERISTWKKEGHYFWADPENWNSSSKAAPHLEQVPCRQDNVVLPGNGRTFSILLPITETEVRSVRMSDQSQPFLGREWKSFGRKREFTRGRFTVKYSKYTCDKCTCQDDPKGNYLEEICAIQRPRCGFIPCEYPLTVEGHCCRYCGGRISLRSDASLLAVQTIVDDALEASKFDAYVRRTSNGAVEVLLREKGDYSGIDTAETVESVKSVLQSNGIDVLSTETAGNALTDSRLAVALGPLFGAPLVVLLLLLLGLLYFGYSFGQITSACSEMFSSIRDGIRADKAPPEKPFSFARFENVPEGNVQIADVPTSTGQMLQEDGEGTKNAGGRFENPLYRSRRKKEDERKILDMEAPLSLTTLKDNVDDPVEEVELDIDE